MALSAAPADALVSPPIVQCGRRSISGERVDQPPGAFQRQAIHIDIGHAVSSGGMTRRWPDPRHRRGIRHPVRGILAVSVAAVLAGARGFQAIAEFAAELAPDVLRRLGLPRGTAPSVKCLRLTLQKLEGDRFDRVLSTWLVRQQILTDQLVALDGKTLRGSATATTPAQHLLSAVLPDLGLVIAQQAVSAKTNEIPCVAPLLAPLPLAGAIVTADALHTQAETAHFLVAEKHADYVFTVKDNQPTLKEEIATLGLEAFPPSAHRRDERPRPHRNPRDLDQS